MILNQRRDCKGEVKMLWWLLTSQASTRDDARDMTAQVPLILTMNNGFHMLTVAINQITIAFWVDNLNTLEESKNLNAITERILRESSFQVLAHAQKQITSAM
jgi:hypothetical protein